MAGPIRVRMGIHSGSRCAAGDGYVGIAVHRARADRSRRTRWTGARVRGDSPLLDDSSSLRDLGLHRLKDLAAPQRLYQLGEGEFPRLRSLDRTNLPVPATPFLGRDRELGRGRGAARPAGRAALDARRPRRHRQRHGSRCRWRPTRPTPTRTASRGSHSHPCRIPGSSCRPLRKHSGFGSKEARRWTPRRRRSTASTPSCCSTTPST